ncbi:hypothetical protein, partial [Tannerella sp.]|uniref:hypothetical protein n=1 Tax=Tannerella sp. TaxID=2382127 RepID=UPI0026DCAEA8
MKRNHENYLTMANTTMEVMSRRNGEWSHIPRIVHVVSDIKVTMDKTNEAHRGTLIVTTGATQNKAELIQDAVASVVKLCKPVAVYAVDKNDMKLHDELSVSKASLLQLRDLLLVQRLTHLVQLVESCLHHLNDYGVKEEDVKAAKLLIEQLSTIVTQPRELTAERKSKNELFAELIGELRKQFYLLDSLMKLFDPSELYTEYRNARIIVNLGRRKQKEEEP